MVFRICLVFLMSVLAGAQAYAQKATEPNTEIQIAVQFDGTAPFTADPAFASNTDGQHTPGLDDNANNNVVLTFDNIGYRVDWNVNELDATNVEVLVTLPLLVPEVTWAEIPPGCDTTLSAIEPNGVNADQILRCVIGSLRI